MPLQDSDNFIIGRGTDSYKITYQDLKDDLNYVPTPVGTIDTPTVLEPNDGADLNEGETYEPISSAITAVEAGGAITSETGFIQGDVKNSNTKLTFSDNTELANMVGPITMTDENGDLVTPQTSGITNVTKATTAQIWFQQGYSTNNNTTPVNWDSAEADSTVLGGFVTQTGSHRVMVYCETPGFVWKFNNTLAGTNLDQLVWESDDGINWTQMSNVSYQSLGFGQGYTSGSKYFCLNITNATQMNPNLWTAYASDDLPTILTFADNTDLEYFSPGDVVQSDNVSVVSVDAANSQMVVDGGDWKPVNSNPIYSEDLLDPQGTPSDAFDGDPTTECTFNKTTGVYDREFTGVTSLRIQTRRSNYTNPNKKNMTVSGPGLTTTAFMNPNDLVTIPVTSTTVGPISITGSSGKLAAGIARLEVNGVVLVDSPTGDDSVSLPTLSASATDVIGVNGNALLIGGVSGTWKTGLHIKGAEISSSVELRGSDFATTPPGMDTLKEIIWSINGVEYSAGVTNPWSPLEKLPTNTTVTVKVKYKGNTLEDSDWSPTVTFTTGASIRSLFTRIAALEANDVTDDATDTALLTLIAGLAARIQALEEAN